MVEYEVVVDAENEHEAIEKVKDNLPLYDDNVSSEFGDFYIVP